MFTYVSIIIKKLRNLLLANLFYNGSKICVTGFLWQCSNKYVEGLGHLAAPARGGTSNEAVARRSPAAV